MTTSRSVILSPLAQDDLDGIWDHIALDSPVMAEKYLRKLHKKFQNIADQPMMGRGRPELMPNLRSFPIDGYVVFCRPEGDGITLIRVLHAAGDLDQIDFH